MPLVRVSLINVDRDYWWRTLCSFGMKVKAPASTSAQNVQIPGAIGVDVRVADR